MDEQSLEAVRRRISEWIEEYWTDVYSYALLVASGKQKDAEVLVSEAFEEVFIFLRDHPEEEIREPKQYLRRTVLNRYLSSIRGKMWRSTDSLDQLTTRKGDDSGELLIDIPGRSEEEPEHILIQQEREQETGARIRKAIGETPFNRVMKRVLILYFVEGYSVREIALGCRISPVAVKRYIRDGVGSVRAILSSYLSS